MKSPQLPCPPTFFYFSYAYFCSLYSETDISYWLLPLFLCLIPPSPLYNSLEKFLEYSKCSVNVSCCSYYHHSYHLLLFSLLGPPYVKRLLYIKPSAKDFTYVISLNLIRFYWEHWNRSRKIFRLYKIDLLKIWALLLSFLSQKKRCVPPLQGQHFNVYFILNPCLSLSRPCVLVFWL